MFCSWKEWLTILFFKLCDKEIFKAVMHLLVTLFYGMYLQRAFRYLQMAADAGNSNAMAYLGKVHYSLSNLVNLLF